MSASASASANEESVIRMGQQKGGTCEGFGVVVEPQASQHAGRIAFAEAGVEVEDVIGRC